MSDPQKQPKEKREGIIACILLFFALTAACIVFAILCLYNAKNGFLMRNAAWLSIVASLLLCVVCGLAIRFVVAGKDVLYKTLISGYILILFCLIVCFVLQKTGFFYVIKDAESLQNYLESAGAWMPVFYILLQYLQVVVLPIPSVVSTLAGVALFGPLKTTVYSLVGILLGSLTAFLIGRKLGHKAVAWMVGEETLEKWQAKLKGKDNLVLTLMFLLPVFPDDILCFVAGLSSMSFAYFVTMIVISRILAVTTTCYSIEIIPFNTWWGLTIWGVIFAAFIVAFIIVYKNLDKIQAALSKRFKIFRKKK
ncbi:MAG: TVP38/TMEM64 family protein [Clostridia bacterium]|nr:TVP38/TMEM64 family protein [Clostridia bacterium]